MRGLLYKIIALISSPIYAGKLTSIIRKISDHDHLYVIDIDNTLAHTWPSLNMLSKYKSEFDRYARLPLLDNMVTYVRGLVDQPQNLIVYLTARHPVYHQTTKKWLRSNGLFKGNSDLIVVVKAKEKIAYLEKLTKSKCPVTYIDDLSYYHETGEVKFHTAIISKVKQMNLEYLGMGFIQEIQGRTHD